MKKRLLSAVIAGFMAATPVMAELTFSALSYRTGAYGNNGIPFADGYLDYFTLLQERDGLGGWYQHKAPARPISHVSLADGEATRGGGTIVMWILTLCLSGIWHAVEKSQTSADNVQDSEFGC